MSISPATLPNPIVPGSSVRLDGRLTEYRACLECGSPTKDAAYFLGESTGAPLCWDHMCYPYAVRYLTT